MNQHATEKGEEEPMDLMPVRKMDAGAPLRRFWSWDFCAHHPPPEAAPPRMRSATMDTHVSGASQDVITEKDGWEQMLEHAKTAWDSLFPPKLDADDNSASSSKATKNPTNMTIASREISLNSAQEEQEKQVTLSVIVTEPGTSRAMRVYRGLELFLLAIFVLGMTLRLLNQSGVQFHFILESNEVQN